MGSAKICSAGVMIGLSLPAAVAAQPVTVSSEAGPATEIVVTAQKREQRINDVGLSITAVSGDMLQDRGVNSAEGLVKLVPGLSVAATGFGQNVYTLRGVGFFDKALAGAPAVSVYVDEVPFTSTQSTQAATLDVERVEILKGPQGTLYGQNSTGGAINYIAAKPTNDFSAGARLEYGRFADVIASAFVSGPLSDTLRARAAVQTMQGGAWQRSLTRDDRLGDHNKIQGRLLLEWTPTDRLKILVNVNGYHDGSDTLASQVIAVHPIVPALAPPELAFYAARFPTNARDADWSLGYPQSDNRFYQASVRADYEFGGGIRFTSISDYQNYQQDLSSDLDGITVNSGDFHSFGQVESVNQEIRLSGSTQSLEWIVGANYTHASVVDDQLASISAVSANQPIPTLPRFNFFGIDSATKVDSYAVFGNIEYRFTDQLSFVGGLRFTQSNRRYIGCSTAPDTSAARQFEALQALIKGSFVPIAAGGCLTLDANFDPVLIRSHLNENNLSIRAGVNYKTAGDTLLYASFNRGYKAGGYPTVNATNVEQLNLIHQERLIAYELGFKAPMFNRRAHLNAAVFYYDYVNKQLTGRIFNPIFGTLEALVAVPKSRVLGVEASVQATPVEGLVLSVAATYVDTKVQRFVGFDLGTTATPVDLSGSHYTYTPAFSAVADVEYSFGIGNGKDAFIGASSQSASVAYASFVGNAITRVRPYTLLDLRAGIQAHDGRWQASIWGRNVTNEYYWTGVFTGSDVTTRQPGRPATYGISFAVKLGSP